MLVVFYSKVGNVRRFAGKVSEFGIKCLDINEHKVVNEKFVLVTPTHGFGLVPDDVKAFLDKNHENMIAVASSGNRNWGAGLFAKSGETISDQYNVPLLLKFENSGFKKDVDLFVERVHELYDKMD